MKRLINFVLIAGAVCGAALLVLSFFFALYRNKSGAMEPTIHADEEMIMRRTSNVSRGDIIGFVPKPKSPPSE